MQYRRLGDTGMKISEIGLGGWLTFGNAIDIERARAVIDNAFDAGINFLDTADAYAAGRCEDVWGQLLQPRRRTDYVLASKVFFPMSTGPNDQGLSRKHVIESCHASLKRLRTDYLDLYQCHRHDPDTPLEETIRAMDDLIHQGKVIYWGFSEWPVEQIEKCLQICSAGGYYRPKSSQPQYNAIHRTPEQAVFPLCHKAGIGQVVFSPLAQGVLTGKYRPADPLPPDSRAQDPRQNQFIKGLVENKPLLAKVQKLTPLARELRCTMSQLALAWILRRPEVSSCIIGATRPEQVDENAAASGITITPSTIARIDEILA